MDRRQRVYIIRNTENGRIKIGITSDVRGRLMNLESQSGCRLELLFNTRRISNAKGLEQLAHEHFSEFRILGEWFGRGIIVSDVERFIKCNIYNFDTPIKEERVYLTNNIFGIIKHRITDEKPKAKKANYQKPQISKMSNGEQFVLDEPLTHFVRISKNKYKHRKTGVIYEIRYINKQWLAKIT